MKVLENLQSFTEKKWTLSLVISSLLCVFLIASCFNLGLFTSLNPTISFTETGSSPPYPLSLPRFAYLISGSKGDLHKLWRVLQALYHPRNQYIVHLDLESPPEERLQLADWIEKDQLFTQVGNVYMITKANMVTYRGPTMVSNTLHACAILLKRGKDWDWFINLSASDYPLITQDDLIHSFSKFDRRLNFIDHTSDLGWKENGRGKPLMIDPGLYSAEKSEILWVRPKRSLPTSFKLFTDSGDMQLGSTGNCLSVTHRGSAWMVLSHEFVEYLVWGWDNLPRTLLMYYTNFVSSPESYFHTVICNEPQFAETVLNHDLHYISWEDPPTQHPLLLSMDDLGKMIDSNAAFARKFKQDDPVLDKIDQELLGRVNGSVTPGRWCSGKPRCSNVKNPDKIKRSPGSKRLAKLISKLVTPEEKRKQCI